MRFAASAGVAQPGVIMGCSHRLADLAARAEALVGEARPAQVVEGSLVQVETLALAPDLAVPVDSQSAEVGALGRLVLT